MEPVKKQLYDYVRELSSLVPNSDDLSEIVAFSVVTGLIPFNNYKTPQNNLLLAQPDNHNNHRYIGDELLFNEVKSIYTAFESSIQISKTEEPLNALITLHSNIDILIQELKTDSYIRRNELLDNISESINRSKKNYQDKLRKEGMILINDVYQRGKLNGNRNAMFGDYNLIQKNFVKFR